MKDKSIYLYIVRANQTEIMNKDIQAIVLIEICEQSWTVIFSIVYYDVTSANCVSF